MKGITPKELREIKQFGLSWEYSWKEDFIRDFARMKSSIYTLNEAIDEVLLFVMGEKKGIGSAGKTRCP